MKRVLCAMSGGVDSSVAAALLVQQGYEVVGVTMKLWQGEDDPFAAHRFGGCCTIGSSEDARRVAVALDIPYYVLNLQDEFHQAVVDDFVSEYAKGRTPNPCARCNEHIKFRAFLDRADELGCDLMATGHYARIEQDENGWHLRRGDDVRKDQSYVLGMLTQRELSRTLLPIGQMEKPEVRRIAAELGFGVASKPDSQEICFVEDGDYARFVTQRAPEMAVAGAIVDENGKPLGTHKGLAHYTIGQRKGLGVAAPNPLFVSKIDVENNQLIVGERDTLDVFQMSARRATWTNAVPSANTPILAQLRAHARPTPAILVSADEHRFELKFEEAYQGLAPGQMCVLYNGDEVLGSGTID